VWTVVLAITAAGVAASMIARRVEHRGAPVAWWRPTRVEITALSLALLFGALGARPSPRAKDRVSALALAQMIKDHRQGLRVIDARVGLDAATYMIPGAERLAAAGAMAPGDRVVIYGDGDADAERAWRSLRGAGAAGVQVLSGGMAAWEDEVLSPAAPAAPSDSALARYRAARALSLYFGGVPTGRRAAGARAVASIRRRNTC
jgi:rhodanese-related sulfurtransferase